MTVYTILCKDIVIGKLQIDDQNRYRYLPREEGIRVVEQNFPLLNDFKKEHDWGEPIPFFQNKIRNASRFGRELDIGSFTDPFRMILQDV